MARSSTNSRKKAAAKKVAKKATTKKSAKKAASKKTAKKATKKATTKKTAKKATKKATTKKTAKKATKKATTKKTAKKATKKATAKKATKKTTTKKATAKKTAKKATAKQTKTKGTANASAEKKEADAALAASKTVKNRRGRKTVLEAAMAAEADRQGYVVVNGRRVRRISVSAERITKKKSASQNKSKEASKATRGTVKSKLSDEELDSFRLLLIEKRRELLRALDAMENEALRHDSGETSTMPIHMADVGSDVYEQDLKLSISASERERIREIDAALERIKNGTYGICELSGKAIRKTRLRAKPWARMTIDSAREAERTGRR